MIRTLQKIVLRLAQIIALGAVFASGAAQAAAVEYQVGPAASWIKPVVIAPHADYSSLGDRDGTQYVILDRQIRIGATQERYFHLAQRATTTEGLEHIGNVEIEFNPAFEHLTIHSIKVIRNENARDALTNADIKVIQREKDLDHFIYDGSKTASLFLDDLRIGDVVEYSYTLAGSNPVFDGRSAGIIDLQWATPTGLVNGRLLFASDHHALVALRNSNLAIAESDRDGYHEYSWHEANVAALHVPNDSPDWYDPYPQLQWSEYADWNAVAVWATKLFEHSDVVGQQTKAEAARIAAASPDDGQRMLAVLKFVQRDIRYMGVEIGPGSHAPNGPETVLTRRFGDCKDKALLMVAMLRQMGIRAEPALVNPEIDRELSELQPSPRRFSHAIVHVTLGSKEYWLDPTWNEQSGNLEHLVEANYGVALLLSDDTKALSEMHQTANSLRKQQFNVEIDASQGIDKPTAMRVESIYEGPSANRMRHTIASEPAAERAKDYLSYYGDYYDGVASAKPFSVEDQSDANKISMIEWYTIGDFWTRSSSGKGRQASFYATDLRDDLKIPRDSERSAPLGVPHPIELTFITKVTLPDDFDISDENESVKDPSFQFDHKVTLSGHVLTVFDHYISTADAVAPQQLVLYTKNVKRVRALLGYTLHASSGPVSNSDSRADLKGFWSVTLLLLFIVALPTMAMRRQFRREQAATGVNLSSINLQGTYGYVPTFTVETKGPPLWNPNASALWSLLLSPLFGTVLVWRNWLTMGEPGRARISLYWLIGGLIVLVVVLFQTNQTLSTCTELAHLMFWYFLQGRPQARYVAARYGTAYPKKPWLWPLVLAVLGVTLDVSIDMAINGSWRRYLPPT